MLYLSTKDNPYSPHTHWDEWFMWDILAGYNTCGLVARVTPLPTPTPYPGDGEEQAVEAAIKEFVAHDPTGIYVLVDDAERDEAKNEYETDAA